MKTVGHFFINIIVMILIITSCISLLTFTFLSSTKDIISKETIVELVKEIDFIELMGEKAYNEIVSILEQIGIPSDYIDYILENESLKEYMGNYIAEEVSSILYDKELPVISEQELANLLSNGLDQVVIELENQQIEVSTYLTEERQEQIHEKIKIYVPEIVAKIPEVERLIETKISGKEEVQEGKRKLEQLREINKKVQFVYQMQPTIFLLSILQFALIVVCRRKRFRFIKWVCLSFLLTSIILGLLSKKVPALIQQHYPEEIEFIKTFIDNTCNSIFEVWKQNAQIYFIIAISLIILQIIVIFFSIYKNRRQKDMAIL